MPRHGGRRRLYDMDGFASSFSILSVSLSRLAEYSFFSLIVRRSHDPDDTGCLEDKEGVVYYKDLDCFPCEGPVVKMVPKAAVPAY